MSYFYINMVNISGIPVYIGGHYQKMKRHFLSTNRKKNNQKSELWHKTPNTPNYRTPTQSNSC